LKPGWWGSPWLKKRSTREERKPVTRDDDDDDDDDDDNNNNRAMTLMAAVRTSETSVCSNDTTRHYPTVLSSSGISMINRINQIIFTWRRFVFPLRYGLNPNNLHELRLQRVN
jgi:hypothetical protein